MEPKHTRRTTRLTLLALACGVALWSGGARVVYDAARQLPQAPQRTFAADVARLSEPEGEFDTDNLISNERSYLEVVPALQRAGVSGGAYIGVGPDQNFSYIAHVRPTIAFIVDVRRDNLLLHLLFKALFELAEGRVEYLCLLTDRPFPEKAETWRDAPLQRIVAHIDESSASAPSLSRVSARRLDEAIERSGVPLSREDFETIHRFRAAFVSGGLSLQFQSKGRPPRIYYPTYRELLLDTDHGLGPEFSVRAFARAR
jgi:hypothetical protein